MEPAPEVSFREIAIELTKDNFIQWEIIFRAGTQLSTLTRVMTKREEGVVIQDGQKFVSMLIALMLEDFQKCFNVVRPMNSEQVADLAIELCLSLQGYKLEDFAAFFQMAKRGTYGPVRDRLDYGVIMEMLGKYEVQRNEALYRRQASPMDNEAPAVRIKDGGNEVLSMAGALMEVKDLTTQNYKKIEALHPANKKPDGKA